MRDTKTSPVIALLFFFLFILLSFLFHFSFSHCANLGTETDKQALLAFKSKVADPFGALSTWNDSVNFCLWLGVTCSLKHQRVISVNLSGQNLTEYGMGSRVSTYGDVYSYGILLLETFTGKRPTSDIFAEGLDLHNFVKNALPEQISEVLDPLFVTGGEEGEGTAEEKLKQDQVQESLATILKIGVACSVESPRERMDISDVVNNLQKVKSTLLRCGIN